MSRTGAIAHGPLRGRGRVVWAPLLACAALVLLPTSAAAHAIGLSRGDYRVTAEGVEVTLVLARAEAMAAVPALDAHGRHSMDDEPLAAAHAELARGTIDKIRVTTASGPCSSTLIGASLTEQDGIEIRGVYLCPPSEAPLTVSLPLLDDLSHGHRHAAHVDGGAPAEHLLFGQHAAFAIDRNAASADAPSFAQQWGGFVRMGAEHILTGYDHLLFLFALVLAGGTVRSLALAVTSFTVAHSVTLALAVLGFVAPPGQWVEPAIALSVAYVGAENLWARPATRPWITFPFGLVHGFGFAGALGDIDIPRVEMPWALLSFNIGVEIGQLASLLVLGLSVTRLRQRSWFARRAVPVMSAAIVVTGLVWFVGRLCDPTMQVHIATFLRARYG
jgi:hydrogenase/urease accessory protein HupE